MAIEADKERIRSYVKQGFDWVKEHGDEHDIQLSRIDLNTLTINSMDLCVLAQASRRPFAEILYALYLANVHDGGTAWCENHGFIATGDEDLVAYTDECWRRLLEEEGIAAGG